MQAPDLTPQQRESYVAVQRNKLAWVTLWFTFGLFAIGFIAFIVLVFIDRDWDSAKGFIGIVDAALGVSCRTIVKNMFPSKGEKGFWESFFGIFGTRYTGKAPTE